MHFKLLSATESDKTYLLKLRKLTMVEHFEKVGLFLSDEEHLFRLSDDYQCSYIIIHNEVRIGMLKYQELDDKFEIMQIQISPEFQGQGFGRKIVQQVLELSKAKNVELTVLKENPALMLYKRLGFEIIGEDQYEFHMRTNK